MDISRFLPVRTREPSRKRSFFLLVFQYKSAAGRAQSLIVAPALALLPQCGRMLVAPGLSHRVYRPHRSHQFYAIGYFEKISSARLNAFSAASAGFIPPWMMSAQAVGQTCSFWSWA